MSIPPVRHRTVVQQECMLGAVVVVPTTGFRYDESLAEHFAVLHISDQRPTPGESTQDLPGKLLCDRKWLGMAC